jgi:hypothetical protein
MLALLLGFAPGAWGAQTNSVTNVGFSAYAIGGTNNPTLTLFRGETYVFQISAPGHPFWIKTAAVTGTANAYNAGVVNNGIQSGTLTFTVPANAPGTLYYICQFHSAMKGTISTIDPPAPPVVRILSIEVGSSVVITSTGAAGWSAVPEYSTQIPATTWTDVPGFTNVLENGTNRTTFELVEPVTGTNLFFRIRNSRN